MGSGLAIIQFHLASQPQPACYSSNYAGIIQSNCPFSARPCPAWVKITRTDETHTERSDYRQCTALQWMIARPAPPSSWSLDGAPGNTIEN
ncbi:protein of unknown function [Nitrospira defluvii]|uniref:Uncharacterized protein n=1 Tax=Nitrospira defluvii TaxID=330214 RepID=D8PGC5_9BACT|nr:protein of unknown function [Nitrospira defluvii]